MTKQIPPIPEIMQLPHYEGKLDRVGPVDKGLFTYDVIFREKQ